MVIGQDTMQTHSDRAAEIASQLFQIHILYETADEAYRTFRTSLCDVPDEQRITTSVDWLPAYQIEARC